MMKPGNRSGSSFTCSNIPAQLSPEVQVCLAYNTYKYFQKAQVNYTFSREGTTIKLNGTSSEYTIPTPRSLEIKQKIAKGNGHNWYAAVERHIYCKQHKLQAAGVDTWLETLTKLHSSHSNFLVIPYNHVKTNEKAPHSWQWDHSFHPSLKGPKFQSLHCHRN